MRRMTFVEILMKSLSKKKKVVALSVFVSIFLFGLPFAWILSDSHHSTSHLYLNRSLDEFIQLPSVEQNDPEIIVAIRSLVTSEPVLRKTINELGMTVSMDELKNRIDLSFNHSLNTLDVSVIHHDAREAEALANEIAMISLQEIEKELRIQNMIFIPSTTNGETFSFGQFLVFCLVISAFIGLFIGILLAVVLEMLESFPKVELKRRKAQQRLQTVFK